MPLNLTQNLKLYEKSPTSTVITETFLPGQIEKLTHTTRMPGGFWTLQFEMPMTEQKYWDWRFNRQLFESIGKATLQTAIFIYFVNKRSMNS